MFDIDIKDYDELLKDINIVVKKFMEDLEKIKENPFIEEWELEEME